MEFNNNNYLPAFPAAGGSTTGSAITGSVYAQVPIKNQFSGPVQHSGFTFTSPTQCNTSSTPRPSIQAFSPMCNMSAPGVGANWQHSAPTSSRQRITRSSPPPQSRGPSWLNGFHSHQSFPQSSSIKNTKRKATNEPDGAPSCKVHLCLDKLKKLHISPRKHNKEEFKKYQEDKRIRDSCWQHFHEVENRLEEELDLEVTEMSLESKSEEKDGPIIQVADGVIELGKKQPILPQHVIKEVQKPCMQLVLWQSPAATIRDVLIGQDKSTSLPKPSKPAVVSTPTCLSYNQTSSIQTQSHSTALSNMETMEVNTNQTSCNFQQNSENLFSRSSIPPFIGKSPVQSLNRHNTGFSTKLNNHCDITSAGSLGYNSSDLSLKDVEMKS